VSGVDTGVTANIKYVIPGVAIALSYPLYSQPSTGDAFTAYWGCDHSQDSCTKKFNNLPNFRGFPYVPQETFTLF
jgi:uncharacterized phage protein (TIGR02218 family)